MLETVRITKNVIETAYFHFSRINKNLKSLVEHILYIKKYCSPLFRPRGCLYTCFFHSWQDLIFYCFPTFSYLLQAFRELPKIDHRHDLVPYFITSVSETSSCPSTLKNNITAFSITKRASSSPQEVGYYWVNRGMELKHKADLYWQMTTLCSVNNCNFCNPFILMAIDFLQDILDQGLL